MQRVLVWTWTWSFLFLNYVVNVNYNLNRRKKRYIDIRQQNVPSTRVLPVIHVIDLFIDTRDMSNKLWDA